MTDSGGPIIFSATTMLIDWLPFSIRSSILIQSKANAKTGKITEIVLVSANHNANSR